MKKGKGAFVIEWYGSHANKEGSAEMESYAMALKVGSFWERITPGGSVIISRILYNTFSNAEKWSYCEPG